jgi:hypothetical protein
VATHGYSASPSNSSSHAIGKSCDDLLSSPCCSNNDASTSTSTCVVTNHVEKINELKAQVTSLKKYLENRHEGKSTLNKILSVQKSPNDKSGLGFFSNNKNKLFMHIGEPSLFRFYMLDKINASLNLLLFKPFVKFDIAYSPPLGDICVLLEGLFDGLVESIESYGLNVNNIRGQGYNKGSNMKGLRHQLKGAFQS